MPLVRRFVAFWYDFLVGDRPELFLGPIVALALAWALLALGVASALVGLVLFVAIALIAAVSVALTLG